MLIDADSGWITGVRRVVSPNCAPRPEGAVAELIVIHGISLPPGEFGGAWIDRLFRNELPADAHPYFAGIQGMRVSAHLLIDRAGACTQYVPLTMSAWHAGESEYRGRCGCNDFSVGIELEGTDDVPYEAAQYATLGRLIGGLRRAVSSLRDADVVGHCDIAPGRKTDPGPSFDWARLHRAIGDARCAP